MTEASRQKRINQTINRARQQGLDVSATFLVECLFDLSDNEESENSSDGDCCLKDLATTRDQNQSKQMKMENDDKEKIHNKKREKICRNKGGPNKPKQAQWTQIFSRDNKKRKRRAKYVSETKEKKRKKEEREYLRSLNDLSKPMPKRFLYGRKRLY